MGKAHDRAEVKPMSKKKSSVKLPKVVRKIIEIPPSPSDPLGSWTGKPANPKEVPVQDADDL
jgi:hypothetical protein